VLLATHWKEVWDAIRTAAVDAWHFIDSNLIHPLMNGVSDLVSWIRSHWQMLATIIATVLLGPVGFIVSYIATHWQQVSHDTAVVVDDVVNFFESLPGRIWNALAGLGSMMYNIGLNIMEGLLHGIESMVGSIVSTVQNVGSSILHSIGSFLGIGSPARKTIEQGAWIGMGWANGILSSAGLVRAAVQHVAGLVALPAGGNLALAGGYGGRGGGSTAAAGPFNITVPVTASAVASPEFLHGLQEIVQEAILRYVMQNQGNGLFLPGHLS
jgi:phage-related protein